MLQVLESRTLGAEEYNSCVNHLLASAIHALRGLAPLNPTDEALALNIWILEATTGTSALANIQPVLSRNVKKEDMVVHHERQKLYISIIYESASENLDMIVDESLLEALSKLLISSQSLDHLHGPTWIQLMYLYIVAKSASKAHALRPFSSSRIMDGLKASCCADHPRADYVRELLLRHVDDLLLWLLEIDITFSNDCKTDLTPSTLLCDLTKLWLSSVPSISSADLGIHMHTTFWGSTRRTLHSRAILICLKGVIRDLSASMSDAGGSNDSTSSPSPSPQDVHILGQALSVIEGMGSLFFSDPSLQPLASGIACYCLSITQLRLPETFAKVLFPALEILTRAAYRVKGARTDIHPLNSKHGIDSILRSVELLERVTPGVGFWNDLLYAVRVLFYLVRVHPEAIQGNNTEILSTSLQLALKWILQSNYRVRPSLDAIQESKIKAMSTSSPLSMIMADCALHIIRLLLALHGNNLSTLSTLPTPVFEVMLLSAIEMCPIAWCDQSMLVFDMVFNLAQTTINFKIRDSSSGSIEIHSLCLLVLDDRETAMSTQQQQTATEVNLGEVLDLCLDIIVDQITSCTKDLLAWLNLAPLFNFLTRPVSVNHPFAHSSSSAATSTTITTTVPLLRLLPISHPRYKVMAEHLLYRWLAEQEQNWIRLQQHQQYQFSSHEKGFAMEEQDRLMQTAGLSEQDQQDVARCRRVAIDILALLGAFLEVSFGGQWPQDGPGAWTHSLHNEYRMPIWLQDVVQSSLFAAFHRQLALNDPHAAMELYKQGMTDLQEADKIRIQTGLRMLHWTSSFLCKP